MSRREEVIQELAQTYVSEEELPLYEMCTGEREFSLREFDLAVARLLVEFAERIESRPTSAEEIAELTGAPVEKIQEGLQAISLPDEFQKDGGR